MVGSQNRKTASSAPNREQPFESVLCFSTLLLSSLDSPQEGGVTSEPVSEFPQRFSVFTLRHRARARAGKVDVVRVELIPGMICGIWKQGFAGWKF